MSNQPQGCNHPRDTIEHALAAGYAYLAGILRIQQDGPQKIAKAALDARNCLISLDPDLVQGPSQIALLKLRGIARKSISLLKADPGPIEQALKELSQCQRESVQPNSVPQTGVVADTISKSTLPIRCEQAFRSYELATTRMEDNPTDEQVYDWLKENSPDEYKLPSFDTWARYLREGRKHYGEQKNQPRAGRKGRSIVRLDEI